MATDFGLKDAAYTLKCFIAAMLAYYIALRLGMSRPFWALMTAYIVSNPMAGAAISKAAFRVGGTIIGAMVALFAVPMLVNAPELLSLFLACWLGFCIYISQLDRTPRAYLTLLAGYTACIVAFPAVSVPQQIFDIATFRVQEILIGIFCGSFIHGLFPTQTVVSILHGRLDKILMDAEKSSADALSHASEALLAKDRHRLALDVSEVHQLSVHLPYDTGRLVPRVRAIRALQDQLSFLLPLTSAMEDRIAALAPYGPLPADVTALLDDARAWLESLSQSGFGDDGQAEALMARADALAERYSRSSREQDLLLFSLLSRVSQLMMRHQLCRQLNDQIRAPSLVSANPQVEQHIRSAGKRVLHRDHYMAFRAGLNAAITLLVACALWIGFGWEEGWNAAMMAGIVCSLFGSSDQPIPVFRTFFYGNLFGLILAFLYNFGIFPAITSFEVLTLSLAPVLLIGGALMYRPQTLLIGMGCTLGFLGSLAMSDRYHADVTFLLNNGIGALVGVGVAVVCISLLHNAGAAQQVERLRRATWAELSDRQALSATLDMRRWFSRMLDRIALLAPRLAPMQEKGAAALQATIADLRVGAMMADLHAGERHDPAVAALLDHLSDHYRKRLKIGDVFYDPALLHQIELVKADVIAQPPSATQRRNLLALIGLQRALFSAADQGQATAEESDKPLPHGAGPTPEPAAG